MSQFWSRLRALFSSPPKPPARTPAPTPPPPPPPPPPADPCTVPQLEAALAAAGRRVTDAMAMLPPKAPTPEIARARQLEFSKAIIAQAQAQRDLAAAKGLPYAVTLDCPAPWSTGAPTPHLVANGHRQALIYLVDEPDPDWDGTNPRCIDPESPEPHLLATVTLERCWAVKLGPPGDERQPKHPLYHAGFESYALQEVVNSPWLLELDLTRRDLRHFVFWFHDETFECIARNLHFTTHRRSFRDALTNAAGLILGD